MPETPSPLGALLEYLKRARGFDFTGYKRATLERRIAKRMQEVAVEDYTSYLEYLEANADEFALLFDTLLINVTAFFRDAADWEYLAENIVPRLLRSVADDRPLRVWCAGCATGEETYTLAMVLAEALGEQAFCERVKIYATDADEAALHVARQGAYVHKAVEVIPEDLRARYFDRADQRYIFRKGLRRNIIFGRNDLVQDAPISRIDLLTCRNTLMYLNAETQARVLGRLHFALNDWGYLFLGKAEMLISHGELFRPVDPKRRVFAKVGRPTMRDRMLTVSHAQHVGADGATAALADAALESAASGQILVDRSGTVCAVNRTARDLFGLIAADRGRPLKDLEVSYRPVDLRSSLDLAIAERRAVSLPRQSFWTSSGESRELEVRIAPLVVADEVAGASISFDDVTARARLEQELVATKDELEAAYEEVQSTVEELETTNEELQSTNEELETTNEELQSTNEELETTNEELQSTNEELETINEELRQRSLELNEVNAFLETILTSMQVAVTVVDPDGMVQMWNEHAVELWGLRNEEAEGRHLLGLDIGLPVGELKAALRSVLVGEEDRVEDVYDATNRRGRAIRCRVTALPLRLDSGVVSGAILLMQEAGDGTRPPLDGS